MDGCWDEIYKFTTTVGEPCSRWKKVIETRKWKTSYRGDLLICSSKSPDIYPAGYALCIVEVIGCRPMIKQDEEKACCEIYPRAWSWFLRNLRIIDPIFSVKGMLSFFDIEIPKDCKIIPQKMKWDIPTKNYKKFF